MISLSTNGTKGGFRQSYGLAFLMAMPTRKNHSRSFSSPMIAETISSMDKIQKLWDSADWNIQFQPNKFNIPHRLERDRLPARLMMIAS